MFMLHWLQLEDWHFQMQKRSPRGPPIELNCWQRLGPSEWPVSDHKHQQHSWEEQKIIYSRSGMEVSINWSPHSTPGVFIAIQKFCKCIGSEYSTHEVNKTQYAPDLQQEAWPQQCWWGVPKQQLWLHLEILQPSESENLMHYSLI